MNLDLANSQNYFHYNKNLQTFANQLRKNMTKAEACLWKYILRADNLLGYSFRRQRPILNYIADFVCFELMLVIEVDGVTHTFENSLEKDMKKDADLQAVGFSVLRFSDTEILTNIQQVRDILSAWIINFEKRLPPPSPASGDKNNY